MLPLTPLPQQDLNPLSTSPSQNSPLLKDRNVATKMWWWKSMCLSLDISVFFATYHRLMMLSTASSHSCCNLIKDLRGKNKENQTKPNSQNKTKQARSALWIQDQPKLLFESKVWHSLCMYVCVWMRETETESSEREIKSFRERDQELQVSGSIKDQKNTKK